MTNKLVVIINSFKVPKIKKLLLYEMKFLVPNYSCLQNLWLGGYRPQIPVLCPLSSTQFVETPSPRTKFLRTPLPFGISVIWREPKNRQMIATFAYAKCLGTVKLNKAVIKPSVSCKACAAMDQTFRFQRHRLIWKKWILQVTNFLHPPMKWFSHETK